MHVQQSLALGGENINKLPVNSRQTKYNSIIEKDELYFSGSPENIDLYYDLLSTRRNSASSSDLNAKLNIVSVLQMEKKTVTTPTPSKPLNLNIMDPLIWPDLKHCHPKQWHIITDDDQLSNTDKATPVSNPLLSFFYKGSEAKNQETISGSVEDMVTEKLNIVEEKFDADWTVLNERKLYKDVLLESPVNKTQLATETSCLNRSPIHNRNEEPVLDLLPLPQPVVNKEPKGFFSFLW